LSCLSSPRIHHHLSTLFFFTDTPPPELYTLSLHDALPILRLHRLGHLPSLVDVGGVPPLYAVSLAGHTVASIILGTRRICSYKRSEEHTSELQSRENLVCRLLLEKKKKNKIS